MKQIKFLFLCLISFISTVFYVQSQNAPVTSLSSVTTCPGTIITLHVTQTNVTAIAGFGLRMDYDAAVLSFVDPNPSSLPGNFYNTDATLYLYGNDITGVQTNDVAGVKKLIIYWSAQAGAATPVAVGGVATICDLKFRYFGGNTSIVFNNSAGGGQNCEYADINGDPLIDAPTASFFVDGSVTQGPAPSAPGAITGSAAPCQGTQNYSVVNVAGVTYTWTNTAVFTGTSTTNQIAYTVDGSSTAGMIYVAGVNACGTGPSDSLAITSIAVPSVAATAAAASAATICPGTTTTLSLTGGTLGDNAVWNWYEGSCTGTFAGTGATLDVMPTVTTDYYVNAAGDCNTTTCVNVTVTVDLESVAATSASAPAICSGSTSALAVTGGTLGTGAAWAWYSVSCGGTAETSPVSPTVSTVYYVRAEGTCNTTTCVSTEVILNTPSVDATGATASATTVCNGTATTLAEVGGTLGTGAAWAWYSVSCGGTAETATVTPTATTVYFLRAEGTCNTTSCVSIEITVDDLSVDATAAVATAATICNGDTSVLTVTGGTLGTGAAWAWYSVSCGGTAEIDTVFPTVTTTYYVRAEGTCNTTNCVNVVVTVNDLSVLATAATAAPAAVCTGSSSTLAVTAGTLGTGATWEWYSVSCGGTAETSPVSPTVTTVYYVRAEGTCNTTTCLSVEVIVNDLSVLATGINANAMLCSGTNDTLTLTGGTLGTGATWNWSATSCGGASIGTSSVVIINPTIATTYYVNAVGVCNTTACLSFTVSINNIPSVTGLTITATDASPCNGAIETFSVPNVPGLTYAWTITPAAATGTSTTNSIVYTFAWGTDSVAVISVTATNSCGTSPAVSLTVNDCTVGIDNVTTNDFSVTNYPNPFNNTTSIEFVLPESGNVIIDVYNVLGEKVTNVTNGYFTQGNNTVTFDASKLSEGLYPYSIKVTSSNNTYTKTKIMSIVK